jgi:hypothetical protein
VEYDKTPEAQARTQIKISGGKLKRNDDRDVDTRDSVTFQKGLGWEIFVIGPGGDIHMASHKIGKYHHSSLLAAGSVAAAGMMRVSSGNLQELNNHSGHYAPQEEHIRQVVRHLQKNNVPLNFTLEIAGKGKYNAEQYMKSSGEGGEGGEESFEKRTTQVVITHFLRVKGVAKVKDAIADKGWRWVPLPRDQFRIEKATGDRPTHEEVRACLQEYFGESAPAEVTRLD